MADPAGTTTNAGAAALPAPCAEARGPRKRRARYALLAALVAAATLVLALFAMYLVRPRPLPELVGLGDVVSGTPHYVYSIEGVDRPVGVALSPDGERLYVAESGGRQKIKAFTRDGELVVSFSAPGTRVGERAPVYVAVDTQGRVYVADRIQASVVVFDAGGRFLDEIIAPARTLSGYVTALVGPMKPGADFSYSLVARHVVYRPPGGEAQVLPPPQAEWGPLGVRFDKAGNLLVTDVADGAQRVRVISRLALDAPSWVTFGEGGTSFGATGQGPGQFQFPNVAAADSRGRVYVSDGNNGRLSAWGRDGSYLLTFGTAGDGAVGLPRGLWSDGKDRLYVVDAVEHNVKVFDVRPARPRFLLQFGTFGTKEGRFNFPNDIVGDDAGWLFIADRANNRVQVWSN